MFAIYAFVVFVLIVGFRTWGYMDRRSSEWGSDDWGTWGLILELGLLLPIVGRAIGVW